MKYNRTCFSFLLLLLLFLPLSAVTAQTPFNKKLTTLPAGKPILWQDPGNIASLDLYHDPGREAGGPKCPCKFIKEDSSGTSPKFIIKDERGVKWKVKIGVEARSETAAVRLLSAIGYFTDDTYFLPVMKVEGLKLNRGRELIYKDLVFNARVEQTEKAKVGHWSWFNNPFLGTKELNGLKVMMALLNNWDIKSDNNRIDYNPKSGQLLYLVSDLGATFGRTGGLGKRTKAQPEHYAKSRFIKQHDLNQINFVMSNEPAPLFWIVYPIIYPFLKDLVKSKMFVQKIPIDDVRWVTQLLTQLSDKQIADAFRGAGFNPAEVSCYTEALHKRIDQLIEITKVRPGFR